MKSLKPILSFTLFAVGVHISIMFSVLAEQNIELLLGIHAFLVILLIIGQLVVKKVKTVDSEKVGMAFLAITVFKMIFSVVFVLIIFRTTDIPKFVLIGNFFGPFFAYLTFEVYTALKELNKQ